jgi:hypothetical protein
MQQQREVMMVCLFDRNQVLMQSLIAETAPRVAAMGTHATHSCIQRLMNQSALSAEDCTAVFLVLLSRDLELKQKMIAGIPQQILSGMSPEKAMRFFLYLDRDILLPWLRDEACTQAAMLDKCRDMYLLS